MQFNSRSVKWFKGSFMNICYIRQYVSKASSCSCFMHLRVQWPVVNLFSFISFPSSSKTWPQTTLQTTLGVKSQMTPLTQTATMILSTLSPMTMARLTCQSSQRMGARWQPPAPSTFSKRKTPLDLHFPVHLFREEKHCPLTISSMISYVSLEPWEWQVWLFLCQKKTLKVDLRGGTQYCCSLPCLDLSFVFTVLAQRWCHAQLALFLMMRWMISALLTLLMALGFPLHPTTSFSQVPRIKWQIISRHTGTIQMKIVLTYDFCLLTR